MKPIDLELLPKAAWRPITPICGRVSNRISERELESISASITLIQNRHVSENNIPVKLWDYSATGFAVMLNPEMAQRRDLAIGQSWMLHLKLNGEELALECRIRNLLDFRGQKRLGLSRHDWTASAFDPSAIVLDKDAVFWAETPSPLLYGEWSTLRLVGISTGLRLIFESNDSALLVAVGQEMQVRMQLPTSGENAYVGRVIRLENTNQEGIRFQLVPQSITSGLANDLGEALAAESHLTPEVLRSMGFPLRFFRNHTSMAFVETIEDYERVLHLRRNAYVHAAKKSEGTQPEAMSSRWDKLSRILCVYHESILVASVTLTFPDSENLALRSETAFPEGHYPCPMPAKTDLIEVSGLCTHRDYRKGDLLQAVFEHVARVFLFSGRHYIVTLADDHLLPLYQKIGFIKKGIPCQYLDRQHHLIQTHCDVVVSGRGMSWLTWYVFFSELVSDLHTKGFLQLKPIPKWILKFKLKLKPLAQKIIRNKIDSIFQNELRVDAKTEEI